MNCLSRGWHVTKQTIAKVNGNLNFEYVPVSQPLISLNAIPEPHLPETIGNTFEINFLILICLWRNTIKKIYILIIERTC